MVGGIMVFDSYSVMEFGKNKSLTLQNLMQSY